MTRTGYNIKSLQITKNWEYFNMHNASYMTVMLHASLIKKPALRHLDIQKSYTNEHWNEFVAIFPNCYNVKNLEAIVRQ